MLAPIQDSMNTGQVLFTSYNRRLYYNAFDGLLILDSLAFPNLVFQQLQSKIKYSLHISYVRAGPVPFWIEIRTRDLNI
jgi:hypothetical protein